MEGVMRRVLSSDPEPFTQLQLVALLEIILTAVGDVPSSKQQYPIYPSQDPYPHKKPGDVPRMSPDYHTSLQQETVILVQDFFLI